MQMIESKGGLQPPYQEKSKETHTFRKKVAKDHGPVWIDEKVKCRHDTYVTEYVETHGPDANTWPHIDHKGKVVEGCSSNFMLGIGSQVNPKNVGFTHRKRQPRDNLMVVMMMSDFAEEQARRNEELKRQRQQIALMQQQLAQMIEAQNNMSQTIAQSVAAALAAYGICPQVGYHPFAPPQSSHSQGSNTTFASSTDST
ncbi:hypothetical protein SLEP1_g9280 [Rubroshorea leprosula]|nr:hypothetical protein SLEP1_g9280 [Rubroshorea leprosula]